MTTSPNIDAVQSLRWAARMQLLAWTALSVAGALALVGDAMVDLAVIQSGPDDALSALLLFLVLLAWLSTATVSAAAQGVVRTMESAGSRWSWGVMSMCVPAFVSAIVFWRLDGLLAATPRPPPPTRGMWLALSPLALFFIVLPMAAVSNRPDVSFPVLFGLIAASRGLWAALTIRACNELTASQHVDTGRARGVAPVGGG